MHAPEKSDKLGAVLGHSLLWKLNLAAEITAANSKGPVGTGEHGKAVGTTDEVVRTKGETPSVAVVEPYAADLVAFGRPPR